MAHELKIRRHSEESNKVISDNLLYMEPRFDWFGFLLIGFGLPFTIGFGAYIYGNSIKKQLAPCYTVIASGNSINDATRLSVPIEYAEQTDPNYRSNGTCDKNVCMYSLIANTGGSPFLQDGKPAGMALFVKSLSEKSVQYNCYIGSCSITTYFDSNQNKVAKISIGNYPVKIKTESAPCSVLPNFDCSKK